jgi:hypothetical protein
MREKREKRDFLHSNDNYQDESVSETRRCKWKKRVEERRAFPPIREQTLTR